MIDPSTEHQPAPSAPERTRTFRDLPLFWKLLIPFFALMLVLGILGAFLIVRDLSVRAKTTLDQELIARSLDVESFMHDRELYLLESGNFAANIQDMARAIDSRDQATVARLLQSVLALKTDLNLLAAIDVNGANVVEFVRERAHGRPAQQPDASWRTAPFVTEALRSVGGDKASGFLQTDAGTQLAIVAPVCSGTSTCAPAGAVIAAITADALVADAQAAVRQAGTPSIGLALFDTTGRPIAARGLRAPSDSLPPAAQPGPVAMLASVDGDEIETVYAPMELQGQRVATLAVATRTGPAFASVRGTGLRLGLILLGAMAGIVAIGALLSRAILKQLRPLLQTNRALGSGDLAARVEVLRNDELGEVARGVNTMADRLQASIETLESRVEQRTQEVQRLLRERTEFFAGLSHELRTPLAVILSQAQLLRDPTFRKTRAGLEDLGHTIGDSAQHLLTHVNEILELARAELGGVELQLEDLDVSEMLRSLRSTVEGLAGAGDLDLRVETTKRLPPVSADRERLRQIVLNLVDNAVKYTPAGGSVELGARARNGDVLVSVRDTGVGIPDDVGERIFEPFYRVPGTTPQKGQASSGLGLALTKRLVEAHGGAIWFDREPKGGTTFTITLPVAKRARRKAKAHA